MRRRDFIKGIVGSTAWPLATRAQQSAMTRVGIVTIQPPTSPPYAAFSQRLRELGYVEGQNLSLDFVNPAQQAEGNAGAVQELIRRRVNIVLALYQPTMAAVVAAAPSVPVVMIAVDYDPLAFGTLRALLGPGKR